MIDFEKIIQVRLIKEDFIKLPNKDHFKLIFIDKNNHNEHSSDLKKIIKYIDNDLTNWINKPNYETIIKRFNSDSHCLLFYYMDQCVGWNWGNKNVTLDWINVYQTLNNGEIYAGGCFVTKSIYRPNDAGLYNYNMICDYWLNNLKYEQIFGYIDSWNKAAIRVNLQTGVKFHKYFLN
jgi:tRNA (Thr-GGU) A37 N-methylase